MKLNLKKDNAKKNDKISLDDVERDALFETDQIAQSLTSLNSGFKERQKKETERFNDSVECGYHLCIVFQNNKMREEFAKEIGVGDKIFIDGMDFAKRFGIDLKTPIPEMKKTKSPIREYSELGEVGF